MIYFNEDAFDAAVEIVSATMENTNITIDAKGGAAVAEYFVALYTRLAMLIDDDDDDDEDEDDDEDDDDEDYDDYDDFEDYEDDEDDDDEDGGEGDDEDEVKPKSVRAAKFEIVRDARGEFRFRLKAVNGEIIAVSEGYKQKASCLKGIESVKKNAAEAVVVEVEL